MSFRIFAPGILPSSYSPDRAQLHPRYERANALQVASACSHNTNCRGIFTTAADKLAAFQQEIVPFGNFVWRQPDLCDGLREQARRPRADTCPLAPAVRHFACAVGIVQASNGLSIDDEDLEVLKSMAEADNVIRSRYIQTGAFSRPEEDALSRTCRALDGSVSAKLFGKGNSN
jgi:hypothetical protein